MNIDYLQNLSNSIKQRCTEYLKDLFDGSEDWWNAEIIVLVMKMVMKMV